MSFISAKIPVITMSMAARVKIRTRAWTIGTPEYGTLRPVRIAIETPASVANRMLERPREASMKKSPIPEGSAKLCAAICAVIMPMMARPRARSSPTMRPE